MLSEAPLLRRPRVVVETSRRVRLGIHSDWIDASRVDADADALARAHAPSTGIRERAPAREVEQQQHLHQQQQQRGPREELYGRTIDG